MESVSFGCNISRMSDKPLVFGIGLNKTGTTSFHTAMEILGWKSLHNHKRIRDTLMNPKTSADDPLGPFISEGFNTFSDEPIPSIFGQLNVCYPNAKFVITVRDYESRLHSIVKHVRQVQEGKRKGNWTKVSHSYLWEHHLRHHRKVHQLFEDGIGTRLLVLNICKGEGWEKLCPFLGVDIPDKPFPCRNRFTKSHLNPFHEYL